MKKLIKRCEEAIRQEVLTDLKGKLVSQCNRYCHLNEESGKYRVVDVTVDIYDETFYDDYGGGFDYTKINITVEAETLKAKKTRYFKYDLI